MYAIALGGKGGAIAAVSKLKKLGSQCVVIGAWSTSLDRLASVEAFEAVYERLLVRVRCGDEFQDASRGQVLLVDPHAEG